MRSVDGSPTTAFTVLECEGSRRLGSRPRRYLLTGQANGSLAMWDLTTAMDGLGQAPGTPPSLPSDPCLPSALPLPLPEHLSSVPAPPCPVTFPDPLTCGTAAFRPVPPDPTCICALQPAASQRKS